MSRKAVLESIERNAQKLIADNRRLRAENERLAASRDRLREENRALTARHGEIERRLVVKELAGGFAGEATDRKGIKTARARVNRLMREVDTCIALLNKES